MVIVRGEATKEVVQTPVVSDTKEDAGARVEPAAVDSPFCNDNKLLLFWGTSLSAALMHK